MVGERGFQYHVGQKELSFDLVFCWLKSRSPLSEAWENGLWVLTFPKTCEIQQQRPNPLNNSPWPPDPKNDIILKTYLELLGWQMTVGQTETHLEIRIDFGNAKI